MATQARKAAMFHTFKRVMHNGIKEPINYLTFNEFISAVNAIQAGDAKQIEELIIMTYVNDYEMQMKIGPLMNKIKEILNYKSK